MAKTQKHLDLARLTPRAAIAAAALIGLGAMANPASATVYTLGGDFSDVNNPNGVWSITQGSTLLTHYPQPTDPNTLNFAAGNGFWGVGPSFNSDVPFVLKTTADGSGAYNTDAFLTGDVILHSPNTGGPLFINWTAPSDGTISFSSDLWYAHTPVERSNDVSDVLGGVVLDTVRVDDTHNRSNQIATLSGSGVTVTAGEVLAFEFVQSPGQQFGSVDGVSETVDFTPSAAGVPEPATWALLLVGFGGLGTVLRRNRATFAA